MANKKMFKGSKGSVVAPLNLVRNEAGGIAYALSDKEALAQFAVTGMFGQTFYASGESQLEKVKDLATKVSPEFLAQVAVYSRSASFMKDMPAFLLGVLMVRDPKLFQKVFPYVMDNGRMIRNFCQMVRSGVFGRKSFGSMPKRLVAGWLNSRSDRQLFNDAIGNDPSLADVIKMVHPKPLSKEREAMYAYVIGNEKKVSELSEHLPQVVKDFEGFKAAIAAKDLNRKVPAGAGFQRLTALALTERDWAEIARTMSWTQLRINLNTLERHGVFKDPEMVNFVAEKLANEETIRKEKVFPYELYAAFRNVSGTMPEQIRTALEMAAKFAVKNVPAFAADGVLIAVDSSGSMDSGVGGTGGQVSSMRCCDVAALLASCLASVNPVAEVVRFDTDTKKVNLNLSEGVLQNAANIGIAGGGTDCSSPLRFWNQQNKKADLVVMISDNQSWAQQSQFVHGRTGMMHEWNQFKSRNPNAKLVCLDIQPYGTVQASNSQDIMNIGGFSDAVFLAMKKFLYSEKSFVETIESYYHSTISEKSS